MLSILIVNWNGTKYVDGCFTAIKNKVSGPYEVIVVDNNSTDGSPDLISEKYPWVKLIRSADNLGFGKGNNLAARHSMGEVLLLLNLDTELLIDPSPIASTLHQDESIGCVGAEMCNGDGVVVPNCGHFPTPWRMLLFVSLFWKPYRGAYGPHEMGAQRVDWVEGSWILIRREVWNRVGGFDENIFMYGEDGDLCRNLADLGLQVVHMPVVAYRHYTGWSVHRLAYQFAGFRYYHQKHSGTFQRAVAGAILYLGLKARIWSYAVLALLSGQARHKEKADALRKVDRIWDRLTEPGFGPHVLNEKATPCEGE